MGWTALDNGEFSGDAPIDAFTTALQRIASAYQDRFGRPPRLREVLHAFKIVVQAAPDEYLDDPERASGDWLPPIAPSARRALPVDDFQATWSEEPQPDGTYFVQHRPAGPDVASCKLAQDGRTLKISYQILDPHLSDDDCRSLIVHALLKDFANDHYALLADQIAFRNERDLSTPPLIVPYPR